MQLLKDKLLSASLRHHMASAITATEKFQFAPQNTKACKKCFDKKLLDTKVFSSGETEQNLSSISKRKMIHQAGKVWQQLGFLIQYCMCSKADVSLNAGIGGGLGSLLVAVLHNSIPS